MRKSFSAFAVILTMAGCASMMPPSSELKMATGAQILLVPVGAVNLEADQSIFDGKLGLIGIAIDAAAKSDVDLEGKSKEAKQAIVQEKIQEFFAQELAKGMEGCGYRTSVADQLLAKDAKGWAKDHSPLSGDYALNKGQKYLLEMRVQQIRITKNLLNAQMCMTADAKQYATEKLTYQHTYTVNNRDSLGAMAGRSCATLNHFSPDDPERDAELRSQAKSAIQVLATRMAEKICSENRN
jgi:hypothetical protein